MIRDYQTVKNIIAYLDTSKNYLPIYSTTIEGKLDAGDSKVFIFTINTYELNIVYSQEKVHCRLKSLRKIQKE